MRTKHAWVSGIAGLMCAGALLAAAEEPKPGEHEWPEVAYNGKVRDGAWLERAYARFKDQIGHLEEKYFDLGPAEFWSKIITRGISAVAIGGGRTFFSFLIDAKTSGTIATEPVLDVGGCTYIGGKVLQVLGNDAAILHADSLNGDPLLRIKGLPTSGIVDGKYWHGLVVAVGTYQYVTVLGSAKTVLDCRPVPVDRTPLTRDQFAEALNGGLKISIWDMTRSKTASTSISMKDGKARQQWRYEVKAKPIE